MKYNSQYQVVEVKDQSRWRIKDREKDTTLDTYQVKEVQDFLPGLKLLPLDDVLNMQGCILATRKLLFDLHEFHKAAALGVKWKDVSQSVPVLWAVFRLIFHLVGKRGL